MNKVLNLKNVFFLKEDRDGETKNSKKDYRDLTSDDIHYQNIEKLVREHGSNLFVTYTTIDKIGINPQSRFKTPIGVYAYPVDQFKTKNIISGAMPFTGEAQYKFIKFFILKNTDKVVTVDKSGNTNRDKDFNYFVSYIISNNPDLKKHAFNSKLQTPFGRFWNVTRVANMDPIGWNKELREYDVDAVVDYGSSIIHENEPIQAAILNTTIIEPVYTIENKSNEDLSFQEFLNKLDTFMKYNDKLSFIRTMSEKSKNPEIKQYINDFVKKTDEKIYAAENIKTNQKALINLSYDENPYIRKLVAFNLNTPVTALMKLSNDSECDVVRVVLTNPNANENVFENILKNNKHCGLALHDMIKITDFALENSSLTLLSTLLNKNNTHINTHLANSSRTPPEVLEKLLETSDNDYNISTDIAKNKNTAPETLVKLSRNFNEITRYQVARNKNTPISVLETLTTDPDEDVSRMAMKILNIRKNEK